ncbi:MAG: ribonuclease J, partial [bacterium]|nr:ribonuclease J [bacterium]
MTENHPHRGPRPDRAGGRQAPHTNPSRPHSNVPRRTRPLSADMKSTPSAAPSAPAPARHGSERRGMDQGRPRGGRPSRGRASDKKMLPPMKHVTQEKGHADSILRFVPLGGLEEIGRNCSFFEYKDEIIIIDVGIQFPEEATPGVDYIIPNVSYLEARKKNIRGILLTHGHYDHIAAIHYLIEKLGNPTIYTADITKAIVARRHEEFVNAPKLNFRTIKDGDKVKISENFTAEFFNVGHTIPDALGFILDTPAGKMVSFGDFRLDITKDGEPEHLDIFKRIGTLGVHTIFMDSTNALREGFSSSERIVEQNLELLIKNAKGRIIIATFASLLVRIIELISIAERLGRKVAVNGRSMKDNLATAEQLGYFKSKKDTMIPVEDIGKFRDEKILILTTCAQGEPNAGLMKIVNGEHKVVRLKKNDTVVFSSSVIPGNE